MPWLHYDIHDSDSQWVHLGDKPEDADKAMDVLEDRYWHSWHSEYLQANFDRPKSIPREVVEAPPPEELSRLIKKEWDVIAAAHRNIALLRRFFPTVPGVRYAEDPYED